MENISVSLDNPMVFLWIKDDSEYVNSTILKANQEHPWKFKGWYCCGKTTLDSAKTS